MTERDILNILNESVSEEENEIIEQYTAGTMVMASKQMRLNSLACLRNVLKRAQAKTPALIIIEELP